MNPASMHRQVQLRAEKATGGADLQQGEQALQTIGTQSLELHADKEGDRR